MENLTALRSYVQADTGAQVAAESTLRLILTHSNLPNTRFPELRLSLTTEGTVSDLRRKVYQATGTPPSAQRLLLKTSAGSLLCEVGGNGTTPLASFGPRNGFVLHVQDTDPHSMSARGGLEDLSRVEKYVMSDEIYDQREDTARKHKQKMRREVDPNWTFVASAKADQPPSNHPIDHDSLKVGQRCEVIPGGRRGVIAYVGDDKGVQLGAKDVLWVGVKYDEPVGKNDGSVRGVCFFQNCPANYGGLARAELVSAGPEFTPIDDDLDSLNSDDEI